MEGIEQAYHLKDDEELCISNNPLQKTNDDKIMIIEDSIKKSLLSQQSNKKENYHCDRILKLLILFLIIGLIGFGVAILYLFIND